MNRSINRLNFFMGLDIILAAAFSLFSACNSQKNAPQMDYATWPVQYGEINVTVTATGTVLPQNRLEIKPPVAGRVEEIMVREGESVKRGQILAWLSSTERAALLDAARARGMEELRHWEALYKATPLMAPLDGTIIARNIEPGQTISAQDVLFVLCDRLIIEAKADETDISGIAIGQTTRITLDAYPGINMTGRVDHIAYEAKTVNNVTTYTIQVLPEAPPPFLRSGMTATVQIFTMTKTNVLVVPAAAVQMQGKETYVLRPDPKNSTPVKTPIAIGLSDGKHTEVISGITAGEKIFIAKVNLPVKTEAQSKRNPFMPAPPRGMRRP